MDTERRRREAGGSGRSVDQPGDLDLVNEDLLLAKVARDRRDQALIKPRADNESSRQRRLVQRAD